MLEFDSAKHKYKLDGKAIPCVSDVCRFLSREVYGEVNKAAMDQAADRGTRVHAATVEYDKDGCCSVDEDIAGYVQAYANFKREHNANWYYTEQMGYLKYRGDFYVGGTFDREGMLDGIPTILDIKTTSEITKKHQLLYGVQLRLYKMIYEQMMGTDHFDPILVVLHLNKDGTYEMIDIMENYIGLVTNSCLDLAYALKKVSKRGKKNG